MRAEGAAVAAAGSRGSPSSEGAGAAEDFDHAPTWKRNEKLVYLANFVHMTLYTMCLGGVFDNFLYSISQEQQVLVPDDPIFLGEGFPAPAPGFVDTFGAFELTFSIRPSSRKVAYPPNSSCRQLYTCGSSIIHITDGSGNADCCRVGNRMPLMFFGNSSTQLYLAMDAVGQNESTDRKEYLALQHCNTKHELKVEEWTRIKVKASGLEMSKGQISDHSSGGAVLLFVNGEKVCEVPGTGYHKLPSRQHAHVFFGSLSAPFVDDHLPANAELKDVKYGKPASNMFVGIVNSIQGVLSMALMCPIGWVGDHMSRYRFLRFNVFVGVAAAALLAAAVALLSLPMLFAGICIFTFYQQSISSLLNAALADNVPKARRTRAGGNYKIYSALAMSLGPGVQVVVMLLLPGEGGWTWRTFNCMLLPGWVLLLGVGFAVFAMTPVGSKISRIPDVDEALQQASPVRGPMQRLNPAWLEERVLFKVRRRMLVATSVNVFFIGTLLANGMTVRYFNLYFTQILRFGPIQLCLLNAVCRLFIAGFVLLMKPLAVRMGRSNLALALHLGSALFMVGIYGGHVFQPSALIACGCYLMRFACLHARDPLLYAITMDCVPPSQRSRWAALNSLRTLSFSASAVLGGYLADHYGYEFSFDITAASLVGCTALFLPVLLWFPRAEGAGLEGEEALNADPPSPAARATQEADSGAKLPPATAAAGAAAAGTLAPHCGQV